MTTPRYETLTASTSKALDAKVTAAIRQGAEERGGVAVVCYAGATGQAWVWAQAVRWER